MTMSQTQGTRSVLPAQADNPDPAPRPDRPTIVGGRERTAADEEAYQRSVLEQARIDIAAGW